MYGTRKSNKERIDKMNYRLCTGEKEIYNTYWNVFSTFGYEEAIFDINSLSGDEGVLRLFADTGELHCSTVLCGVKNAKGYAEAAAVCIEAALAVGYPDLKVKISCPDSEVSELLYLYSLDEYADFAEGEFTIEGFSGKNVIFTGSVKDNAVICTFDLEAGSNAMGNNMPGTSPSKTLIYAEKDAEGIAYEISYTLRLSGCLVVTYIGDGSIEDCEKEAIDSGASDIIRVFANGKLQIKNIADKEITETDYETFVGYYDDEDCGCSHDHHDHDCDCGHDHHDHDCDCGRHHHH